MDIDEIRRQNIRILEKEIGGITRLSEVMEMSYTQCLNYRNGVPDSKTGKIRGIRKDTARRFEVAGNKPIGWLDINHDENISPVIKADENILRITERCKNEIVINQHHNVLGSMGGGILLRDLPGQITGWSVTAEWANKNIPSNTGKENLCIVTGFGDSMRGMFNSGDPLLVDTGVRELQFDGTYFFRIGDEGFIKRLQRIPGNGIRAISENKAYEAWNITPDMDFEILGRVVKAWKSEDL